MTPNTTFEKSMFAVAVLWSGTCRGMAESLDQGLVSGLQAVGQDLCHVHVPEWHEAVGNFRVSTVKVSHVALYPGLLGDANWHRKQTEGMGVIPVRPSGCAPLGRPLWLSLTLRARVTQGKHTRQWGCGLPERLPVRVRSREL